MRPTTFTLALALIGCAGTTAEPQEPPAAQAAEPAATETEPAANADSDEPAAPDTTGLRWRITAHPAQLTMAQRAHFRLRRSVTNEAREVRDAMHSMAEFTFDGASSMELNMAFGNGARESLWSALPPGRTVFDEREMGESLFPAPGTYVITMTVDGETSSVEVVVRP